MAYDGSEYEREDAETLRARRAALRAFAQGVAEAVQSLALPETYLEAERAVRSVTVADRLIVRVREATLGDEEEDMPPPAPWATSPAEAGEEKQESAPPVGFAATLPMNREGQEESDISPDRVPMTGQTTCVCLASNPINGAEKEESAAPPPDERGGMKEEAPLVRDPLRLRLRAYADRVMEAATFIPKPDNYLEGERAGRYGLACERMLTQLYTSPQAKAPRLDGFDEDIEDDIDEPLSDGRTKLFRPRNLGLDPADSRKLWADWQFELEEKLNERPEANRRCAEERGFWSNGMPYVPEPPFEEPVRYNPDGSRVSTREEEHRRAALHRELQAAANLAHGWTPPDPP